MKLSELQKKEIININDGSLIGKIIDININDIGKIESLVVEKTKYLKGLFNSESDSLIDYSKIKKIGEDVILVEL